MFLENEYASRRFKVLSGAFARADFEALCIIFTSLHLGLIYLAINFVIAQKLFVRAGACNFALVHDDNSVRVLNRGNALGDYYFCCLRRIFGKRGAYLRVRMGIDRRCGIIENDYRGLF